MSGTKLRLDHNLIKSYIERALYSELISYLDENFKVALNDIGQPTPFVVERENIEVLITVLKGTNDSYVLKAVFKALRNCVVLGSHEIVSFILNDDCILRHVSEVLLHTDDNTKMVLQLLINSIVNYQDSAIKIWPLLENHLISLLHNEDFSYLTAALFYNILRLNKDLKFPVELYNIVLESCQSKCEANEYSYFLLDLFIEDTNFFASFDKIAAKHRCFAFTYIVQNNKYDFDVGAIKYLSERFKKKSDCILKTSSSYIEQIEPEEVALLLELLAALSAQEKYMTFIQLDKSLLINCTFLLQNIQKIGKESQNDFTPIEKVSNADVAKTSPVFGFKANLIKLIGNMCWKNTDNQNQFRELDGIPILLDCCNIDDRNPFITQWCILAIRNLCENNLENQAIIASMSRQGIVDSSTLHKLGLTLHDDGSNKIGIVPLDVFKSDKN